jgi:hypothetical protein
MKRKKFIWQDGKLTGASDKITYNSETDKFIVFEFQEGTYLVQAVTI